MTRSQSDGFTFLEVLVVAVILAVLAAVAIPTYNGYVTRQRIAVVENLAKAASVTLASNYRRTSSTPSDPAELEALVALPDPANFDVVTGGGALGNPSWVQVRESADHEIISMQIMFR